MVEEIVKFNVPYTGTYGDIGKECWIDKSAKPHRFNLPQDLKDIVLLRQRVSKLERAILFCGPGEEQGIQFVILTDDRSVMKPQMFYRLSGIEVKTSRYNIIKPLKRVFEECQITGRVVYVGMDNHIRIYDHNKYQEMQQPPK